MLSLLTHKYLMKKRIKKAAITHGLREIMDSVC